MDYYSALDKVDTSIEYPKVIETQDGLNQAFVYDIETGKLPEAYQVADILYTEIPWTAGYDIFNKRAGVKGSSYGEFLRAVGAIINGTDKPVVILCGKKPAKQLPAPSYQVETDLNGAVSQVLCYRIHPNTFNNRNYLTILSSLAEKYNVIGDFCCGYGNSGKVFAEHGKHFILSDINPRCIGYIKNSMHDWKL